MVDKSDSPAWAVPGWWTLDIARVQRSRAGTRCYGKDQRGRRVSCHSVSANDSWEVSETMAKPATIRRLSIIWVNTLPHHLAASSNQSIQMKVRFVLCVSVDLGPVNKWGCYILFFKDLCEPFAKWTEIQMNKHQVQWKRQKGFLDLNLASFGTAVKYIFCMQRKESNTDFSILVSFLFSVSWTSMKGEKGKKKRDCPFGLLSSKLSHLHAESVKFASLKLF